MSLDDDDNNIYKELPLIFWECGGSVDAPDLKSVEKYRGGSSPPTPIALMFPW